MVLLRYLINIPLLALLVWVLFDAHPTEGGIEFSFFNENFKTVPILLVFFVCGYLFGRLDAWFSYAPLRRSLRQQRKENKVLNKEHEKLHATVSDLKHNIEGLQEQTRVAAEQNILPHTEKEKTAGGVLWRLKKIFSAKDK